MLILMMIVNMILMMIMMMILMMIMMTKPYDYDDGTDDDDHKNDSYTAASAAPGASVPCFLFLAPRFVFLVLVLDSGFRLPVRFQSSLVKSYMDIA